MMVETILESAQDFGMSNGALPQWKRELLQRRLARGRGVTPGAPAPPPPPPPPPPPAPAPAPDDDEELRYGPGIVKRLKSRYLSLALRDAPRRRPSVLRRAASLEHLLDERPPPAPRARAPRPASLAAAAPHPPAPRRDAVKRARSVDALSRLDSREEPPPAPSPRAPRPPRRPQPLLRETERPPPDVVRSTLRKFESAPPRRAAPAARVSAVLRGLEPRRSLTPDGPEPDLGPPPATPPPPVPLEPIPTPPIVEVLPATPPPAPSLEPESPTETPTPPAPNLETINSAAPKTAPAEPSENEAELPSADEVECAARVVPRAALEEIARAGSVVRYAFGAANPVLLARPPRRVGVIRPMPPAPCASPSPPRSPPPPSPERAPLVNGHSTPEPGALSRIGAAGIERAWSGSAVKRISPAPAAPAWARGAGGVGGAGAGRARPPPPAATSVVFNFSHRKEVPDYIENDGIVLRAGRRNRIKAGEVGVVILRPELVCVETDADVDAEADAGPPSPCDVRFVNDNVLINGKSSMPLKPNKDRIAKLKLQFDDSLTRTFEYPSETSLSEDSPPAPAPAPPAPAPPAPAPPAALADNTHIASAALSRYTPSKSCAAAFQLGLASPHRPAHHTPGAVNGTGGAGGGEGQGEGPAEGEGQAGGQSWSDARAHRTDLLF